MPVLILVMQTQSLQCLQSFHYNGDNSCLPFNGKGIYNFKADNKNDNKLIINFTTQFCIGSISNKFGAIDYREVFLKGNVYDFLVDYNAIDKSDILDIHKYLMVENNI